jgi:hypothetical protein
MRRSAWIGLVAAAALGAAAGVAVRRWPRVGRASSGVAQAAPASKGRACLVPKITPAEVSPSIQTNPAAADYDPVKLLMVGVSGQALFEGETRNPTWAPAMEKAVGAPLLRDLQTMIPELQKGRLQCRSRTCELSWTSLGPERDRAVYLATLLTRVAPEVHWAKRGGPEVGAYLVFRPSSSFGDDERAAASYFDVSDPEKFAQRFAERRRETYAAAREGRLRLNPHLERQHIQLPQ